MLFDGPSGERASTQDGCSLDPLGLGEEEIHFLQKFLKIIRANPEKAEKMVNEEEKEFPSMRSESVRTLHKRAAENMMKMAKKKKFSKPKKVYKIKKKGQNEKSRKGKGSKSTVKRINRKRKLGKKKKHIKNKNNNKMKQKKKKIRFISRMKKMKQKKKKMKRNRQTTKFQGKSKEVENCTSLWAELTNIGLGVATSLKKQVKVIDMLIKLILSQANSIKSSDRITNGKRAKGEDFTEHKNILEQALAGNPCVAGTERSVKATGKESHPIPKLMFSHIVKTSFGLIMGPDLQ